HTVSLAEGDPGLRPPCSYERCLLPRRSGSPRAECQGSPTKNLSAIRRRVHDQASWTATWNWRTTVLLCASVARHVTVVVPSGNSDPDAGVQIAATGPSTTSLAVTE